MYNVHCPHSALSTVENIILKKKNTFSFYRTVLLEPFSQLNENFNSLKIKTNNSSCL